MSGIRERNTKPKILIRSLLHRQGFRFRLHTRNLPAKDKIERNRTNDHKTGEALRASGWRVGIVWECALRGAGKNIEGVHRALQTGLLVTPR